MRFASAFFAAAAGLLLVGCGGSDGGVNGRGEVSGVIMDETGTVVRDARVFYDGPGGATDDREVKSNSAGVYVLPNIPATDVVVRAEIRRNGVRYYGQNVARVNNGERTRSLNIAVFREDQIASLEGEVRDRQGFLVQGARIFLRPTTNDTLPSSATTVTGSDGAFSMGGLRANLSYRVQVNASGYNSDLDTITLAPGERRFINFVMPDGQIVNVPKPQNFFAVSWTSPREETVRSKGARSVDIMKSILQKRTPPKSFGPRLTAGGNRIEVDLFWDRIDSTALLGYGIYRGIDNGQLSNIDFFRDPQADSFYDLSDELVEGRTYRYGVTSLDTLYDPDTGEGESEVSDLDSVVPLGDLTLGNVTASANPTFRWEPAFGATKYSVYLFDEYPTIGVTSRYNNSTSPVTGTQFTYPGAALTSGRTYFYIVLGESDAGDKSVSRVGSFTVQ